MLEMVEARRNAEKVEQCHDLFSGLLDAAQDEQGDEAALSDDELVGGYSSSRLSDIFLKATCPSSQGTCLSFFLLDMRWDPSLLPAVFALNSVLQTTAHTLCFSLALLALYPDEQERLYQHIKGVMSSPNGIPVGSRDLNSYRVLTSP